LAERVGVIEIDLPGGIRVRVDSGVNEKALRRVLSAVRGKRPVLAVLNTRPVKR